MIAAALPPGGDGDTPEPCVDECEVSFVRGLEVPSAERHLKTLAD